MEGPPLFNDLMITVKQVARNRLYFENPQPEVANFILLCPYRLINGYSVNYFGFPHEFLKIMSALFCCPIDIFNDPYYNKLS